MKLGLPNILTLIRIISLPALVVIYYSPFSYAHQTAALLMLLSALTDFFDGYIARKYNLSSKLGAFLDPVADKITISVGMIVVSTEYSYLLLSIFTMIIVVREITISGLREWMAEMGKRSKIKVQYIAKVKTFLQALGLWFLIWFHPGEPAWEFHLGVFLVGLAVLLTLWSMFVYLRLVWEDLKSSL